MSGQKYRRTNFEEDEDGGDVGAPVCVSPMDDAHLSLGGGPPVAPLPRGRTYDPVSVSFKMAAAMLGRRSRLERALLVLVFILTVVALVLGVMLHAQRGGMMAMAGHGGTLEPQQSGAKHATPGEIAHPPRELCTSRVCVTVASAMLNAMDDSVDACTDFYQYACGGWIKSHPIPPGEARWDAFGVLKQANQIVLKNILEAPLTAADNETGSKAELKARVYYRSCLDVDKVIDRLGAGPLLDLMEEFGGWALGPVGGARPWSEEGWELQGALEKLHALGLANFFTMWVEPDEKNPLVNILQFDQGGLVLQREQYLNKTVSQDPILTAYLNFMVSLGTLLGATDVNNTRAQFTDVIELEQAIANISTPQEDRRDDEKMYHKMTLADLQQSAPFIDWLHYVNSMLAVANYTVNGSEPVLVYEPHYIQQMSTLVEQTLNKTNGKRTMHNYIMWHLVRMMSQFLSKPFQDARKEFMKIMTGISGDEEQWRYCTADTDSVLGLALGAMYVRQTFQGESKASAETMIQGIKDAFVANLPKLPWMDAETKEAATEKARAVVEMIGYPEFIRNATQLDEKYQELEMKENEYFLNNYRAIKYNGKRNFEKLRQPPDNLSWSMTPPTVNAYYQPTKNQIVFPAGILQRPFYDKDYPRSLNYGAMGVVMGHELTHGFDDQGREYDKRGFLRPWWNETVVEKFKKQTECMTTQYSAYTSFGEHLKGKQTLGENIADNGGLKSAFRAYEQWAELQGGDEAGLPGLNFTHRQLFFLAFSQVWCSNSRPQDNHNSILSDPHSMPRYRVLGPLANSVEFSRHFSCPPGSPMNPTNKCVVW